MISMVQPIAAGNALRLFIQPPAGAVRWRILRKSEDAFLGPDETTDTGAIIAYEGDLRVVIDAHSLPNEQAAFYRPFYRMADGSWVDGSTAHGTPEATYQDLSTDVLALVRSRLEAALQVEVQRGNIAMPSGYVSVFTAPPLNDGGVQLPLVTMHVESEVPEHRGIGEHLGDDAFSAESGDWSDVEGWLASVTLQIIGWSLNADERAEMRRAIRRAIVVNLSVFSAAGLDCVDLQTSDVDALNGEFGVPAMFQTVNTFTCIAPVRVGGRAPAIRDVQVDAHTN